MKSMEIFKQIPLYRYLAFCNESKNLKKTVLDCGAGGDSPPLSLFFSHGYHTTGIDIDLGQVEMANQFGLSRGQNLNIHQGDMKNLEFEDESFSFVYSYNSIFHMMKDQVERTFLEMKRVTSINGLMFVNFLTTNDFRVGDGIDLGNNQFQQYEDDAQVIHSYYEHGEADYLFEDMEVLYKEDRVLERIFEGQKIRQGFVDYILLKK